MFKYPVESGIPLPSFKKDGRLPDDNNDDELVAEGVQGIIHRTYRSYSEAGRALASRARQRVWSKRDGSKYIVPATAIENVARRLSRKISKEHKKYLNK